MSSLGAWHPKAYSRANTALSVTWFGGTAETEVNTQDADSCELVAVRIERTSANSRRILGEIVVPARAANVWNILTDYNRLSIHVPNLVESRVVSVQTPQQQPGDGRYQCRLFQKGAQKIVGFEFGASVTMDMVESILPTVPATTAAVASTTTTSNNSDDQQEQLLQGRKVAFKCHDSFFFNEFDGEWKAVEQVDAATGNIETLLSYVVDVRPKGPVPVAALEWRIREDVPTNLRAMKTATLKSIQQRQQQQQQYRRKSATTAVAGVTDSESLTAYVEANMNRALPSKNTNNNGVKRRNGTATTQTRNNNGAAATRRTKVSTRSNGATTRTASSIPLTPRQRQEQAAAEAARRALRVRPTITPFAQAATPPPKSQQQRHGSTQQQQQQQPPRRLTRVKVDWDDNETLGAYLKRP